MVVESVEEYANVIVVKDIVAFGYVGADLVGLVEAMKRHVKKFRIIAEHYFGWFRRSKVVARLNLIEVL